MFAVIYFCFTKIVRETLCKFMHIYTKKNAYLYNIMINRKLWGIFRVSLHSLRKRPIFLLFCFLDLLFCLDISDSNETETKKHHFCRFCINTSLFVANKALIFSDLRLYMVNHTPPPPVLALAGWVSSLPKIFYFFIFIFCKIL